MEFRELLQELGLNMQEVLERFSGNENLLQRFLCKFPNEKTFQALEAAYQAGDWEETDRAVHTLKGIAANLGFVTLQEDCTLLLDDLRGGQQNLPALYARIEKEYDRVTTHIRDFTLKTGKPL